MSSSLTTGSAAPGTPATPLGEAAPGVRPAGAAPADELQGGQRYRLGTMIGEGGTGILYAATRIDTLQIVAIKILREDPALAPDDRARLRARFRREMDLCERLAHPNIVALLDNGETPDGRLFAVFEYVPGRTLRAVLAADGALPAVTTGVLMGQVLDGLANAHRNGVVHRDLKPQNVMVMVVDGQPHAKILDFGIGALLPDARRGDEKTLTQSTEVLGSPQYCSPEQLRGEPPTAKSDFYAWGLVVIECLTGHPVMEGASVAEILYQQLSPAEVALPPPIAAHPLGAVLRDALNKDPRQRVESAEELAERFRAIHFAALVGGFHYGTVRRAVPGWTRQAPRPPAAVPAAAERRQITALCCRVTVVAETGQTSDDVALQELLEAYQAQWLTRCSDIAIRYGGHAGGALGDTLLFYFGYPEGIDRPPQRACRAALEMARNAGQGTAMQRQALSHIPSGWRVEIAAAIHVGTVLSQARITPGGITMSAAVGLQRAAAPGHILLSDDAARWLERYVDSAATPLRFAVPGAAPQPVRELLGERYEHAPFESLEHGVAIPIVGRERQWTALISAWQKTLRAVARSGRVAAAKPPRATLLVGDAGIGKSRLVHELRETVRAQHHAFADCVCLPEQTNHALFPILRFVKAHWQLDADPDTAAAALGQMLELLDGDRAAARATLGAWLGLSGGAGMLRWSGSRQQQALFDMLCQLIASLGGGKPVLLIVEDVQWIDCTTLEFLDVLLRHPACAAVCVVLTSRPEQLERWRHNAERLTLRRLSRAETRRLISALLPGVVADDASLEFLAQRTDGIPLFVEEMIRELEFNGALTSSDGTLPDLAAAGQCPLPGSLREMLGWTLERVDGAGDTVQLAATIGIEVDARLLADASPHPAAVLEEHLARLLEGRILYARHRLGGATYVFRHALLRDAAYESMPAAARYASHERVARALCQRTGGADPAGRSASIAEHFARALAFAEAVPYGIRAARRALERSLHEDAIRYAEAVRGWLTRCDYAGQEEDAIAVDLTLSHALMARFGWGEPRVREHTGRVLQRIGALRDVKFAAGALWTIAVYHHVAGERADVRRIGTQLAELASASGRADLDVAANTMRGMSFWIDGNYPLARAALEAALTAYDPLRDNGNRHVFGLDLRAWATAGLASVMWCIDDDTERALALAREAVYLATCTDHLPSIGLTLMYLARMQQCAGDRDGARITSAAALRLSRVYGLNAVERYAAITHAWCDGDRATALANLEALRASGCLLGLTYYASLVAEIDAANADWDGAIATLDDCLALCDSTDERYYAAELLIRKARYLQQTHARCDGSAIEQIYREAIAAAKQGGMPRIVKKAQTELRLLQCVVHSTAGE
jgi:TOMM system kinase/cyclase fusion protein